VRINAYLARAGVASRRRADEIIKAGRVTVNGEPARLNSDISDSDRVEVDGKPLQAQQLRYILINKPPHVVTTLKDEQGRPTVIDLVKTNERVVPVGRLDVNTTGALLLTNDGLLANGLMHPSRLIDKVYEAEVDGRITPEILNKLSNGVKLEDGVTAPAKARRLSASKLELIIHEGRNHQVKRMLAAMGLGVKRLHRSKYGPIGLEGLRPGAWRELTPAEINALKTATITDNGNQQKAQKSTR
jgi:23S rRNA pseudouridine2605 synthase